METTLETARAYRTAFENGKWDRMAGSCIQTKAQMKADHPGLSLEDLEDLYRAYRNGFTAK